MPYFSAGIKSEEMEANTYVENLKAVFRFEPNEVYMSNMRLLNCGAVRKQAGTATYNELCGALSVIKRIALYDDNVLLDSVDKFPLWASFRSFNNTNDDNMSRHNNLNKKNMGFVSEVSEANPSQETVQQLGESSTITNDTNTTAKSYISLRDVLSFLESSTYVPTNVYKGLRLEIEFNTNLADICPASVGGTDGVNTLRPFLSYERVMNPELMSKVMSGYKGTQFSPVELSTVFVDPAGDAEQNKNFTLNSYNNKNLERILVVKSPLTGGTSSTKYGQTGSLAMNKERFNFISGGDTLIPQDVSSDNRRLALLNDLYSDCDVAYAGMSPNEGDTTVSSADEQVGQTSYIAYGVNSFVSNNFQLKYQRTGVTGGPQSNEGMNLNIYGEVLKAVIRDGDSYRVQYV
tara:strand:- start:8917 stop:10131 length:1215 start_codon:yes stop_codon:yes gene_type:complete